eukprot:TRINITY_DN2608_c0_g3_i4.p1 TRINITY_DN2608_c0_g3~~TRINITY_DN2608_c0_g3_i4.p1  ORF type:complete len:180 (-),score=54.05 TRINITY_DN2608_c0_g3_i4:78-617(-)
MLRAPPHEASPTTTIPTVTFSLKDPSQVTMLANVVKQLGGIVLQEFSSKITHVVCETGTVSLKAAMAAVSGRWVVTPQWVLQCQAESHFVLEASYGRQVVSRLCGKRVFVTEAYAADTSYRFDVYNTLMKQGQGVIVSKEEAADIMLVCTPHPVRVAGSAVMMTKAEFFRFLMAPDPPP